MERTRGIEPLALAWKAKVLPLYEIRTLIYLLFNGGGTRNRTINLAVAEFSRLFEHLARIPPIFTFIFHTLYIKVSILMNIAETPEIVKHPLYNDVREVIAELKSQNLLQYGAGFCLAISDLVQNLLTQKNIKSSLLEVKLTLLSNNPPNFHVIGLQKGELLNGQIGTHVVVCIEHEIPLIIDCSIALHLAQPFDWVCGAIKKDDAELAKFERNGFTLIYREKIGAQFPAIHQRNIRERIDLDTKFEKSIAQNRKLMNFSIGLFVAIVLLLTYDIGTTVHIYSLSGRNYELIQQGQKADIQIRDRIALVDEKTINNEQHIFKNDDRMNLLDSRIDNLEKLFHFKKK
jgi:hypothetical protein